MKKIKNIYKALLSFLLVFVFAVIGSLSTSPAITTWYANLNKPSFNPPNYLFAPVWTILYIFMAIAFYLIWKNELKSNTIKAKKYFIIQLFLNMFWSVAFFALKMPFMAFLVIIALWIFIFLCIKEFFKINKIAGYLLVPYLIWVSFATILNLFIVLLN